MILCALLFSAATAPTAAAQYVPPPQHPTAQSTAPRPHIPTIVTGVTVVDVPVIALNGQGQPVSALNRQDFRLYDDGNPQRLTAFDSAPRPVSLAIVVDTSQRAALFQAQRAARVLSQILVGADGRAAVFIPGYPARQVSRFRHGARTLVATVRQLKLGPTRSRLSDALDLALLHLRYQPINRTRAVIVISQTDPRVGPAGREVVEMAMNNAIPIFRVYPPQPPGAAPDNPINPETNGTGAGSQSQQPYIPPVGAKGNPPPPADDSMNLGALVFPIAKAIAGVMQSGQWNYVHATGGLNLHAGNERQFDQRLAEVGNALRSIYHLFYIPDDLGPFPAVHHIQVRLIALAPARKTVFRRSYLGYQPRR
ncbi:MAG: hypothetical protein ACRD2F_03890 [Terriglobales bacterium]